MARRMIPLLRGQRSNPPTPPRGLAIGRSYAISTVRLSLCLSVRLSVCLSVCLSFCLSVCLSVVLSVNRITHERVYGCRSNTVGKARVILYKWLNFGVDPESGCASTITFPLPSGLRAASTWEAVGFCGRHRQTDVLAGLSSWLGG